MHRIRVRQAYLRSFFEIHKSYLWFLNAEGIGADVLFKKRKPRFPKTSETCELLGKGIRSSIKSLDPFGQTKAKEELELLRKTRCKKVLLWIYENYKNDPSPFVQQFAKKALDYAESV